jgi:hypothetical protein
MEMIADEYGRIDSSAPKAWSITVNGTNYSGSNTIGMSKNTTKQLASGSTTITHNTNGTKTFSYSFSQEIGITWNGDTWIGTKSGSGSGTLDTIPRQATLTSAPNFTDAVNPTIKYSNPAGSAVSGLDACISFSSDSSATPAISYRAVGKTGTSYTFNLTTAEKNTLKNNTSGNSRTVYFHLRTTIGSAKYYSSLAKTFTISDTSISFSGTGYDTNSRTTALTGNNKYIVKGYSNLYYNVNATSASGSISSFTATCAGRTLSSNTGTFYGATSADISFKATDNRGNTASANLGGTTLINYFKPTLQLKIIPTTTNGDLTLQISGTFFNQSFGKVKNTLTCRYSISHEGSGYSSGSSFDLSISGNSYSGSITISGLDYKNAYIVGVNAYDELDEVQINNQRTVGKPVFDWDNTEVNFNTDVRVRGNLRLKGDGNYGNALYFGDGSYAYMSEPSDDNLKFHASGLTLDAPTINLDGTTINLDATTVNLAGTNKVNGSLQITYGGYYKTLGEQKTLHTDSGRYYHEGQSLELIGSSRIVNQINGYILVWHYFASNKVYTENINYTFVPKHCINIAGGKITLPLHMDKGIHGSKTLFITDDGTKTTIKGHTANDEEYIITVPGTTDKTITLSSNKQWVLKYIIGW